MVTKYFAETPLNEPVKYKVRHISNKMELLDREIKYLINKIKIWKPKQEAAINQTDSKTEQATENQEELPLDLATEADAEKDKSAGEQTISNNEQEQQQEVPVTDEMQESLVIPEREEPPSESKVEEDTHQEL